MWLWFTSWSQRRYGACSQLVENHSTLGINLVVTMAWPLGIGWVGKGALLQLSVSYLLLKGDPQRT